MAHKPRVHEARFRIGERVEIGSTIISKWTGAEGLVTAVIESPYSRTLDKYIVQIDGFEQKQTLWDIQLKKQTL